MNDFSTESGELDEQQRVELLEVIRQQRCQIRQKLMLLLEHPDVPTSFKENLEVAKFLRKELGLKFN